MKKVYVCHAFAGKKSNREAITHICQRLVHFGVMPISPVHAFGYLNDNIPEERALAMEFCDELIEIADCLFFTGEWQESEGCNREWDTAMQLFKPVYIVKGWRDGEPLFVTEPKWWGESGGK